MDIHIPLAAGKIGEFFEIPRVKLLEKTKEYTHTKPKTKKLFGIIAIIVGFIGVLLPIVPGLWLMFLGLEFLGIEILFFDKAIRFFKEKRVVEKILANRVVFGILGCILVFYWYNAFLD